MFDMEGDGNYSTTDTMLRAEYLGTVLALILLGSLALLVVGAAFGIFSLSAIPQGWFLLYSTVVLIVATWTFGKDTLMAVKDFKKK